MYVWVKHPFGGNTYALSVNSEYSMMFKILKLTYQPIQDITWKSVFILTEFTIFYWGLKKKQSIAFLLSLYIAARLSTSTSLPICFNWYFSERLHKYDVCDVA